MLYWAVLSAEAIRMVEPSDEVIAKINRQTGRHFTAEQLHIRGAIAANDQPSVDRRLRIKRDAIPVLAELAIGDKPRMAAPVMRNHNAWASEDLPVHRLFDGLSEDGQDSIRRLLLAYYWPRCPTGDEWALFIDSGVWREMSIGVYFGSVTCSICDEDLDAYCEHAPAKEYDGQLCTMDLGNPREFEELSHAWKGRLANTETFAAGYRPMKHPDAIDVAKVAMTKAAKLTEAPLSWWDELGANPEPKSWFEEMGFKH